MIYDWYKEYFAKKVLPGFLKEMQPCTEGDGFYPWLEMTDKAAYDEFSFWEEKIRDSWARKGDKAQFKEFCQKWVMAHINLKPKYLAAMSPDSAQRSLI